MAVEEIRPAVPADPGAVPVGVTTKAGYAATAVSGLAFVLVLVLNVDQQQAALIATSVMTVVSFAVTQVGRYSQAHAKVERSTK